MPLVEMNWSPDDRKLREFGLVNIVALPLIAWIWSAGLYTVLVFAGVGILMAMMSVARPLTIRPFYLVLSCLAYPIGRVVSEVSLLFMYYVVLVPIGLIFRVTGRDALCRKIKPGADSYWHARVQPTSTGSYFHQY